MGRVEEIAKEVDDGRQSEQQQKTGSSRIRQGRSTGPVDRRAQHAQSFGRSTGPVDRSALTAGTNSRVFWVDRPGRPEGTDCNQPNSRVFWVDRSGRPEEEVGSRSTVPVDRQSGFWVKSADPLYEVFKPMLILGLRITGKRDSKGVLLHSKRPRAIVIIFLI